MPLSDDIEKLSYLQGYHQAGGGRRPLTAEIAQLLNAIGGLGTSYYASQEAEAKRQKLIDENKTILQHYGLPSDQDVAKAQADYFKRNQIFQNRQSVSSPNVIGPRPEQLAPIGSFIETYKPQSAPITEEEKTRAEQLNQQYQQNLGTPPSPPAITEETVKQRLGNLYPVRNTTPAQIETIAKAQLYMGKPAENTVTISTPEEAIVSGKKTGDTMSKTDFQASVSAFNANSGLTPLGMKFATDYFQKYGQSPITGIGGAKYTAKIVNELGAKGANPSDTGVNKALYNGLAGELAAVQKMQGSIMSFEGTAMKNLQNALDRSGVVDRWGSPAIDKWKLFVQGKYAGDPDVLAFDAAVHVAANEIAKVTSTSTGNLVPQQEREEYQKLMSTALNIPAFQSVAEVLMADMKSREASFPEQINRITEEMRRLGTPQNTPSKETGNLPSKKPTSLDEAAGNLLRANGQSDTPANRKHAINMGWVK